MNKCMALENRDAVTPFHAIKKRKKKLKNYGFVLFLGCTGDTGTRDWVKQHQRSALWLKHENGHVCTGRE
jgi:hypothetical protein